MKAPLFIIVSLLLFSCSNIPFNRKKWNEIDAGVPYYRKDMLEDLTTNHKLIGLKYPELISLLGQAEFRSSDSLIYTIDLHYDVIDPDYGKDLVFTFNKDSIITSFKINEWKNK
ncbi:hypothetical protein A9P82_00740 [Arachidicoccus ginsenosidimutans]|uniref:hypothetical protein n=1 Tax=Arachidicoccus sp. BS20 TaxID=1850526 RepID=UPI0007F179BD|nr:hypothetical protein [Arachidicoccus sp. BS20]ANI87970.1 hypothetical protein A9P82_00740 [Arachidicoccus sp. BS20]